MTEEFREKKNLLKHLISYPALAPLAIGLLIYGLCLTSLVQRVENLTLDQRTLFRAKTQAPPDPRIFFVAIDDTTLAKTGQWPIDRKVYADFMNIIGKAKPALFCYDVFYDQPRGEESDNAFAQAMTDVGIPVLTAAALTNGDDEYTVPKDFDNHWPAPSSLSRDPRAQRDHMILPNARFRPHCDSALAECPKDDFGVTRKIPLYAVANGQLIPTIGLASLLKYWKITPDQIRIVPGEAFYIDSPIVKRRVPIDSNGFYTINFRYDIISDPKNPYSQLPSFSGASLIALLTGYYNKLVENKEVPDLPEVRDKIMIIGTTATSATDLGPTAFQPESPRPYTHLNVIDNILKEDYLHEVPPLWVWAAYVLLGYLSLWPLSRLNFWLGILLPLLLTGAYVWVAFQLFNSQNIVLPVFGPSLAFLLLHIGSVGNQVLSERAAREHLRRTFSAYVSPGILKNIYQNPDSLQLGGAHKDVTILFTDLRNFTSMTEAMDSIELVRQLNEYFTEMVAGINHYNGTLHKYIGDAIMAVWGDVTNEGPVVEAGQCLRSALEMRGALEVLNQRWVGENRPEFHMGVGINHGHVVVGNIGAPQRMEFTVIGDAVNLASRLEGLNKHFGTCIIIGESVYNLTHERFLFRPLARVQVVGKSQPVQIYEVLCEIGQETLCPYPLEWLKLYQEAYHRFLEQRFDAATRLFEACLNDQPGDKTSAMLLELSRRFQQEPPPEDWDGSIQFSSK